MIYNAPKSAVVTVLFIVAVVLGSSGILLAQQPPATSWLPPNAVPGECYAKVFIPPTYQTVTEKVLLRQASEKIEIIPAKFEWVEEQVLVEPESEKWEIVPAQYETVEEKILAKEASFRLEEIPAQYDLVEEKILVKPAETVWKSGRGPIEKVDHSTGEIMCLVDVPATYKTVKKEVVVQPPSTQKVEIPAEYTTIKKKVLVSPPTIKKIKVPAVYKTVKVHKMTVPAQEKRINIPEEHQMVKRTEKVSEGSTDWRRILCETNTSPDLVTRVQNALVKAGFDPGTIDGQLGPATQTAVNAYQQSKGLAFGALTYETIESLGVALR